jgi:putative oxidoreductase
MNGTGVAPWRVVGAAWVDPRKVFRDRGSTRTSNRYIEMRGRSWPKWKNESMKIAAIIARVLLGLMFTVLGLNLWLVLVGILDKPPIDGPLPGGDAGVFLGLLVSSKIMLVVKSLEIAGGALLLISIFAKRYAPLAVVLLTPITVNILLFHLTLTGVSSAGMSLVLLALEGFLIYHYRENFLPIFDGHE